MSRRGCNNQVSASFLVCMQAVDLALLMQQLKPRQQQLL